MKYPENATLQLNLRPGPPMISMDTSSSRGDRLRGRAIDRQAAASSRLEHVPVRLVSEVIDGSGSASYTDDTDSYALANFDTVSPGTLTAWGWT